MGAATPWYDRDQETETTTPSQTTTTALPRPTRPAGCTYAPSERRLQQQQRTQTPTPLYSLRSHSQRRQDPTGKSLPRVRSERKTEREREKQLELQATVRRRGSKVACGVAFFGCLHLSWSEHRPKDLEWVEILAVYWNSLRQLGVVAFFFSYSKRFSAAFLIGFRVWRTWSKVRGAILRVCYCCGSLHHQSLVTVEAWFDTRDCVVGWSCPLSAWMWSRTTRRVNGTVTVSTSRYFRYRGSVSVSGTDWRQCFQSERSTDWVADDKTLSDCFFFFFCTEDKLCALLIVQKWNRKRTHRDLGELCLFEV